MKICIAGGPQVGKTTLGERLAEEVDAAFYSTDATLLGYEWAEQSDFVVSWMMTFRPPWVIEGVPVIRALRKWLKNHPEGKPCDTLYWRFAARTERSRGQESLAKGCQKIYDEIAPELTKRGVSLVAF